MVWVSCLSLVLPSFFQCVYINVGKGIYSIVVDIFWWVLFAIYKEDKHMATIATKATDIAPLL